MKKNDTKKQSGDSRSVVPVMANHLIVGLDETEKAIALSEGNVYQASGRLVTIVRHNDSSEDDLFEDDDEDGDTADTLEETEPLRRPPGAIVIMELSEALMVERMAK